ncbi:MAG: FkbM family methyltransferase [Cytophagaceae bacterium]
MKKMLPVDFIKEVGIAKWIIRTFIRQFYKRILKKDNKIKLVNGLTINLPRNSHFGSEVFVTNCNVDWNSEYFFLENYEKGGCFLDIGAHIGYYTLLLAKKAEIIYAFEPDPRNYNPLENNIKNFSNILFVKKAISSEEGKFSFSLGSSSANSSLISDKNTLQNIEVEVTTIDSIRKSINTKIHGIKTDIQGMDLEALQGGKETILQDKPLIISEIQYSKEVDVFLESVNYTAFSFLRNKDSRKILFSKIPFPKNYNSKMLILIHKEDKRLEKWESFIK